ncbi:hypothetical protein ACFOON_08890 [Novosphingobium piscinae]|uniref:Uncharacterized protein n=1 Tax=Novosphingobium piscinae TaxID=1507448 RepID=A0A7X1KQ29_9SPHN|nr:hypothetical protein [Novosphingobium piscinae]MBC2669075.1 hypothetical protein [Novosphingobium piscinae]
MDFEMQVSEPEVGNQAQLAHAISAFDRSLRDRDREIDLLRLEVARWRSEAEECAGKLALLQMAMQRHLQQCTRDDGDVQRLIAELAEATAQRKEQSAIIVRREQRIIELREKLESGAPVEVRDRGATFSWRRLERWAKRATSRHD